MITGAQGFLGSNFVKYLYDNTDHKIYAVSRSPIRESYHESRFFPIIQDLNEPYGDLMTQVLSEIDYVVHFAGSSNVQRSNQHPLETFNNNVVMTTKLLEIARTHMPSLKQFIFFSTAEVFGPSIGGFRFSEDHRKNPQSPYASTKLAAAEMCKMYFSSYKVPTVITYVMNVFGKNQSHDKFIPKIIKKINEDQEIVLHANSGPDRRNYLHVDDISNAILFIMNKADPGSSYNIVSDVYSDNLEIAKLIASILKKDLKFKLESSDKHHTLSLLDGDNLENLGWKPRIPLHVGLRKYIYEN